MYTKEAYYYSLTTYSPYTLIPAKDAMESARCCNGFLDLPTSKTYFYSRRNAFPHS
jgi:hypothetical protein